QWSLADALALEVVPDELVGVQFRRIAGQEVQFQTTGEPLNILRDHFGDVRGVAVENEEHRVLTAAHEVHQQLDEPRGVEPLGVDLVPECAARVDGGDRAYALAP